MKIAIVGTGYVGLATGVCLAEKGHQVSCVDIDQKKVTQLNLGKSPIYEPELENLLRRNQSEGRISFTTSLSEGIADAVFIFLALPTPPGEDGSADLSYILSVSKEIAKHIQKHTIIICKSTVPLGTCEKIKATVSSLTSVSFDVVSNPEFLREGFAVQDFMHADRVVIGTDSILVQEKLKELYLPFVKNSEQILIMDQKSAELTKYAANAFLATKITFMNEMANFCQISGADVDFIRQGIGADDRIGSKFLFPGIGYGGSCFPKDVQALLQTGKEYGYEFQILKSVNQVNNNQKVLLLKALNKYFDHKLAGKKIAVWGLAFKGETDDVREAPALEIIEKLLIDKVQVSVYDPQAMMNVKQKLGDKVNYATDMYEALEKADALLICTDWKVFKQADLQEIKNKMNQAVIFDGRNLFDLQHMQRNAITYFSIGRRFIQP